MQRTRIDWVAEQSKLLRGIAEEFTRTQPFAGLTIGTGPWQQLGSRLIRNRLG